MNDQPAANDTRVFREDGTVAYDSIEEMMDAMKEAEERAIAATTASQRSISYGGYVLRPMPDYGFLVFGAIATKAERDTGEDAHTVGLLDDSYSRGYRTGMWYSEAVPQGEYGDAHVSTLWPITEDEFRCAEGVYFSTEKVATSEWGREMMRRVHRGWQSEVGATKSEDGAGFVVVEDNQS